MCIPCLRNVSTVTFPLPKMRDQYSMSPCAVNVSAVADPLPKVCTLSSVSAKCEHSHISTSKGARSVFHVCLFSSAVLTQHSLDFAKWRPFTYIMLVFFLWLLDVSADLHLHRFLDNLRCIGPHFGELLLERLLSRWYGVVSNVSLVVTVQFGIHSTLL